jgi:hypothetical protein
MRESNLTVINTWLLVILIGLVAWGIYHKPRPEQKTPVERANRFQPYLNQVGFALDTTTGSLCRTSGLTPTYPAGFEPESNQPVLPLCTELK